MSYAMWIGAPGICTYHDHYQPLSLLGNKTGRKRLSILSFLSFVFSLCPPSVLSLAVPCSIRHPTKASSLVNNQLDRSLPVIKRPRPPRDKMKMAHCHRAAPQRPPLVLDRLMTSKNQTVTRRQQPSGFPRQQPSTPHVQPSATP